MKIIQFTLLILISLNVHSALAGTSVDWVTIQRIDMGWGGEGIYISINEPKPESLQGCNQFRFLMLPSSTPLFKENLSLMLSAFHTQSKVNLRVIGCYGSLREISAVSLVR